MINSVAPVGGKTIGKAVSREDAWVAMLPLWPEAISFE